jgi:hypothetical protein
MASEDAGLVLQLSADIRKLEKAFEKASGTVDKHSTSMERRAQALSNKLGAVGGKADIGKALDKVFTSSRNSLISEGSAKIGVFGSSLSALGVAGIAAAAGIAALGAAYVGAKDAAKFADEIADTADRLHITTTALQEYRYALVKSGGDAKNADAAIEAFSINLGKAQQGLAKSQRAFLAIGFTKAQIKSFKDVDSALEAVIGQLDGLSAVQKDAAIDQLGLTGMKQALDDGVDGMRRLKAEALAMGYVMDEELVKSGGELNDKFEILQHVIDVQLKSALLDLAPILSGLLSQIADLVKQTAALFDHIAARQSASVQELKDRVAYSDKLLAGKGPLGWLTGPPKGQERTFIEQGRAANLAELSAREKAAKAPPKPPAPTKVLLPPTSTARSVASPVRDTTVQRTEDVAQAVARVDQEILSALMGLTNDVRARAALQHEMLMAEQRQFEARINKQIDDIGADKGLSAATKRKLIAELEGVKQSERAAVTLRDIAITRDAQARLGDEALRSKQQEIDAEAELLLQQQNLTLSTDVQAKIALRLVDLAYQRERAELDTIIASKEVSEAERALARAKRDQLDKLQPGAREQAQRNSGTSRDVLGRVQQSRTLNDALSGKARTDELAEIKRLEDQQTITHEEAQQQRAQTDAEYYAARLGAASSFFGNLATLSESSNETLAAIGKAAAIAQATIDGVLAVQKTLASYPYPLNFIMAAAVGVAAAVNVAKIAGMADGGVVYGPGGPRDDAVPVRLSAGEYVVNASATARNTPLLEAINSGADLKASQFSVPGIAQGHSVTNRQGDAHMTYAPNITNPTTSLEALLRQEGRAMRTWVRNEVRNGSLKFSATQTARAR